MASNPVRANRPFNVTTRTELTAAQARDSPDDSYDYPYGYGEYAEYGPWAYGGNVSGGCFLTQKMRADGLRSVLANGQGVQLRKSWLG